MRCQKGMMFVVKLQNFVSETQLQSTGKGWRIQNGRVREDPCDEAAPGERVYRPCGAQPDAQKLR